MREKDSLHKKRETQKQTMQNALHHLASVSARKKITADTVTDNVLFTTCRQVAEKMKIELLKPSEEKLKSSKNPLDEIANASRIRYRQVALKGEWWKEDQGPLLAFAKDDNRPLALIPISANQYEMVDITKGTVKPIYRNAAQAINPLAYTFYRPFSSEVNGLKQLIFSSFLSIERKDILMIIVMGLAGGLIGMINPLVTGIMIDNVIPQTGRIQLVQIGWVILSFAIGKASFELTRQIAMLRMEGKMEAFSQAAVWDRLLSLPVSFFRNYTAGELTMKAMGISRIRQALSNMALNTIIASLFSIFNGLLMFRYNVKLSLTAMALVLAAVGLSLISGFFKIHYERKTIDASNRISGMLLQIIEGISKFRVSGAEHRAFYQWAKLFSKQRKNRFTKETIANISQTFHSVFPVIAMIAVFYTTGGLSKENTLSTGDFVAFSATFSIFMNAMLRLSDTFLNMNQIVPVFESMKPILETLPEYNDEKEDIGELDGDIEAGHITFRYDKDGPVILDDISLKISSGEYVAVVGSSGTGKSTLLRILLGFEEPEKGKVYYSGRDLESVDIRSVRKQLGVVLQNGQLVAGDIFTNIVGSNPNLTLKDAEEAATMAGLDEDIRNMPMGMHTLVSEGGGTLSGGQRQRLMIARAIANKPKILFFDEATSALDNLTQKIVDESLDKLNATRVVIAHRLSTIMHCDRIIVLDKGKIVESGSYEELMSQKGLFTELAKRQLTG